MKCNVLLIAGLGAIRHYSKLLSIEHSPVKVVDEMFSGPGTVG